MTEPHPSATVVVARDAPSDVEVLMLRRNDDLSFHGGAWVFPGGRLDPEDRARAGAGDWVHAAAREAREEAGLAVDISHLVPFAEWVTPEGRPKRFRTLFFIARATSDVEVRVDGSEVVAHRWLSPRAALEAHASSEFEPPPRHPRPSPSPPHAEDRLALRAEELKSVRLTHPEDSSPRGNECSQSASKVRSAAMNASG